MIQLMACHSYDAAQIYLNQCQLESSTNETKSNQFASKIYKSLDNFGGLFVDSVEMSRMCDALIMKGDKKRWDIMSAWWLDDVRSQGISGKGVDLIFRNIPCPTGKELLHWVLTNVNPMGWVSLAQVMVCYTACRLLLTCHQSGPVATIWI